MKNEKHKFNSEKIALVEERTKNNAIQKHLLLQERETEKKDLIIVLSRYQEFINKNKADLESLQKLAIKEKNNKIETEIKSVINEQNRLLEIFTHKFDEKDLEELKALDKQINDALSLANKAIINGNEDLKGSVRVVVKMRGGTDLKKSYDEESILDTKNNTIKFSCKEGNSTIIFPKSDQVVPFFAVYDQTQRNIDMYCGIDKNDNFTIPSNILDTYVKANTNKDINSLPRCFYTTFKQVEDGYSIVLFANGYSGSGKTYSLLGKPGIEPGLIHYGLNNLQNVKQVNVKNIFELYYDFYKGAGTDLVDPKLLNGIRGRLHNIYGTLDTITERIEDETDKFKTYIGSSFRFSDVLKETDYINSLTDKVNMYRKSVDHKRIKATPNNPESSRSHLFIVFEIRFENVTGYISLVDAAGRENPIDIYNTIFNHQGLSFGSLLLNDDLRSLYINPKPQYKPTKLLESIIKRFNRTNAKTQQKILNSLNDDEEKIKLYLLKDYPNPQPLKDLFEILLEGFYINESLNHLKYYFKTKSDPKYKASTYTGFVDFNNDNGYNPAKCYQDPKTNSHYCMMIPVLKYLDTLGQHTNPSQLKPTKFVMICALRPDKCKPNIDTLEFAKEISSIS